MTELRTTSASLNFHKLCQICGGTVAVRAGREEGHRCRIDIDAQRGIES